MEGAGHGTTERGLAWSWRQAIPTSRLPAKPEKVLSLLLHQSFPVHLCCESLYVPPDGVSAFFGTGCIHCDGFLTSSSPDKMSYIARRGLSTLIPPKVRPPRIDAKMGRRWSSFMMLIDVLDRLSQRELPGYLHPSQRSSRSSWLRPFPKAFSCRLEATHTAHSFVDNH